MIQDHYLWKIRPYYRQVAGLLSVGMFAGAVMNIAVVLPAIFLGRAIDTAVALGRGEATYRSLILAAFLYVAGTTLNLCAQIGKRWWLRTANHRTVANMRSNALRGILSWSMERLHKQPIGDTMARVIGDTQVFMIGFNEATTELLDTWLFSISLFTAMVIYDAKLAFIAMAPVPVAFILAYYSGNWVRGRTRAMREANSKLTTSLQEYLTGVRILRLFGKSSDAASRIDILSDSLKQKNLSEARLRLGLQPIYSILVTAGIVAVVWFGGRRVVEGILSTGTLVAFVQLYIRFVGRGHRIPLFFNRIQAAGVAYERLEPMLEPPPSNHPEPKFSSFKPGHITGINSSVTRHTPSSLGPLSLQMSDISFHYPGTDRKAIDDISLTIEQGSLTAITGPIGSGKTALLQLMAGLYQPQVGTVSLGEMAITKWRQEELRTRVGYLPQDPGLFSQTIRDNIGLQNADENLVQKIISESGLENDIGTFPDGLETTIGEGGIRVSGGQRQRIGLARAIAIGGSRSPGALLLDDPFSAVDVDTEAKIIDALRQAYVLTRDKTQRATLIICSHRLSAFPHADRIIVLKEGRIVEDGTHRRLVESGGLYAQIYRAQHVIEKPKAKDK